MPREKSEDKSEKITSQRAENIPVLALGEAKAQGVIRVYWDDWPPSKDNSAIKQ